MRCGPFDDTVILIFIIILLILLNYIVILIDKFNYARLFQLALVAAIDVVPVLT